MKNIKVLTELNNSDIIYQNKDIAYIENFGEDIFHKDILLFSKDGLEKLYTLEFGENLVVDKENLNLYICTLKDGNILIRNSKKEIIAKFPIRDSRESISHISMNMDYLMVRTFVDEDYDEKFYIFDLKNQKPIKISNWKILVEGFKMPKIIRKNNKYYMLYEKTKTASFSSPGLSNRDLEGLSTESLYLAEIDDILIGKTDFIRAAKLYENKDTKTYAYWKVLNDKIFILENKNNKSRIIKRTISNPKEEILEIPNNIVFFKIDGDKEYYIFNENNNFIIYDEKGNILNKFNLDFPTDYIQTEIFRNEILDFSDNLLIINGLLPKGNELQAAKLVYDIKSLELNIIFSDYIKIGDKIL